MRSLCSLTQDDNVEATERKNGNVTAGTDTLSLFSKKM